MRSVKQRLKRLRKPEHRRLVRKNTKCTQRATYKYFNSEDQSVKTQHVHRGLPTNISTQKASPKKHNMFIEGYLQIHRKIFFYSTFPFPLQSFFFQQLLLGANCVLVVAGDPCSVVAVVVENSADYIILLFVKNAIKL